MYQSNPDLWAG